jgi:hypothetical protein
MTLGISFSLGDNGWALKLQLIGIDGLFGEELVV